MNDDELNGLTEQIIGLAFKVSNTIGIGFSEGVYENALAHELRKAGHTAQTQDPIQVHYDGIVVGKFIPDILVNSIIILEIKATRNHDDAFAVQCLNYLKATGKPICLLLNFGKPRLDVKRYRGPQSAST